MFKKLKKFFTPYKWETIFTCEATSKVRYLFSEVGEVDVVVVVQVDTYKGSYRCYYTDGKVKQSMDIVYLAQTYPSLKDKLKEYNITI